jgi:hypothetical protein
MSHLKLRIMIYMIYLLTAIGLSPGGSTHLHTHNTQNTTNNNPATPIQTNVEECGPCPVFASFTLAFALQLRKKHGKPSAWVRKTPVGPKTAPGFSSVQKKKKKKERERDSCIRHSEGRAS